MAYLHFAFLPFHAELQRMCYFNYKVYKKCKSITDKIIEKDLKNAGKFNQILDKKTDMIKEAYFEELFDDLEEKLTTSKKYKKKKRYKKVVKNIQYAYPDIGNDSDSD